MMSAHPGAASAPISPGQRWLADVGPGCATFPGRTKGDKANERDE